MGQYFKPVNLDKGELLDAHMFGYGIKLTESCYVGNGYIDALTYLLANDWHGDRVILCGDYAWESAGDFTDMQARGSAADALLSMADCDPYQASEGFTDRSTDFACCKGNTTLELDADSRRFVEVDVEGSFHIDAGHLRYVIDETAGVFYDREKAPVAFVGEYAGDPYVTRCDPLTIFMAVGNGLGGGDYHGPNEALVGSWAGHGITAADEPPTGFSEIACPFDENGAFLTAPDEEIRRAVKAAGLDWSRASVADLAEAVAAVADLEKEGFGIDLEAERDDARGASGAMGAPAPEHEHDAEGR